WERLSVAESAVGGPLKARSYGSDPRQNPIERAEFIRWARTVEWSLPAEMADGAPIEPGDSVEQTRRRTNDVSRLHPTVAQVAGQLFADRHYRQAVLDTFIRLIEEVRARAKASRDLDGVPLMQEVFSAKNPMLMFQGADAQLGHMWLYSGAVMAFRNVLSHSSV